MADKAKDNPREVTPEGDKGGDLRQSGNQEQEQSVSAAQSGSANPTPEQSSNATGPSSGDAVRVRPVAVVRPLPRVTQPPQPPPQQVPLDLSMHRRTWAEWADQAVQAQPPPVLASEPLISPEDAFIAYQLIRAYQEEEEESEEDQRITEELLLELFEDEAHSGPTRAPSPRPGPSTENHARAVNLSSVSRSRSAAQGAKRKVSGKSEARQPKRKLPKRSTLTAKYTKNTSSSSDSDSD